MRWLWLVAVLAACGGEAPVDEPDAGGAAGIDAGRGFTKRYACDFEFECLPDYYSGSLSTCCSYAEWQALALPKDDSGMSAVSPYCSPTSTTRWTVGNCSETQGSCDEPCEWIYKRDQIP